MNLKRKGSINFTFDLIVMIAIGLLVAIVLISTFQNKAALSRLALNKSMNETMTEGDIAFKELNEYIKKETKGNQEFSLKFDEWGTFEYENVKYGVKFSCLKEINEDMVHVDCELLKVEIKDPKNKSIECNNTNDFVIGLHETECCKNKKLNVCFRIIEAYVRNKDYEFKTVDYTYYDLCNKSIEDIKLEKPDKDITTICWNLGNNEKQPYTLVWRSWNEAYASVHCSPDVFVKNAYLNFQIIDTYDKKIVGYCSIKNDNKVKTCTSDLPFSFYILGSNKCKSVVFNIIPKDNVVKLGKECNEDNLNC